jgi:hypothetical protein
VLGRIVTLQCKKKSILVRGVPRRSRRYTATTARLAAPAERERVDPAAGRLIAPTARYTALWPRYTAGGGANGGSRRRTELGNLRTEEREWSGVTGCRGWGASRSSS